MISRSTKPLPEAQLLPMNVAFSPLTETNGLAIPSCDAEVGMLINGFFKLNEHNFAISTETSLRLILRLCPLFC